MKPPTAQRLLEPGTRATPYRTSFDPALGLGTTLHFVPFQCSISVCRIALLFMKSPTAQRFWAETAATPKSSLSLDPALGLDTTLQVLQVSGAASATSAARSGF